MVEEELRCITQKNWFVDQQFNIISLNLPLVKKIKVDFVAESTTLPSLRDQIQIPNKYNYCRF